MFVEERHNEILEILTIKGKVRVTELSEKFSVTVETIRRDLERLESEKKLKRTHGGAILFADQEEENEIPFKERKILNQKEKILIAKVAIQYVEEEDVLFLDAGSTCLFLAKELPNIRVTVVTNSVLVAYELSQKSEVQVVMSGGNLMRSSLSLAGPAATRSLKNYHINKMFFSCKGFDQDWGISDSNEQQAAIKRVAMEMSDQKILLLDGTKLNKRSFVHIENINKINLVIIDGIVYTSDLKDISMK